MTTLAKRGPTVGTTTGTTWANAANAVDGVAGVNSATYATYTNATASAVGTIEISGFAFSTDIASSDTLNSVTVSLRHFENNTGRFASVRFQAFDGATAIGSQTTCTLATAARNDVATPAVTLAQLRSSTFKIVVTITGAASTQSRVCSIDYVDVTADYTIAPPSITQAAYRFYADDPAPLTLITEYNETNASSSQLLGDETTVNVAQSFLGTGQPLRQAGFFVRRIGNPTTNLTAKLYAHTGTFGNFVTGVGTGSPLATSTTVVATNSLSTTAAWWDFDFAGTVTPSNGTPYVIALEASGLNDSINCAIVSTDNTSPTHPGSGSVLSSTPAWTGAASDRIFRVYATGSNEATSTALAAQDTGYTADTSSGDVNLQVRARLQSTTAIAVPATDDWQLQWERNTSGTWLDVSSTEVVSLADSYPEINANANAGLSTAGAIRAQSFLGNGSKLKSVRFWGYKTGTPTDNVIASLFAHSGTFGVTSVGTGAALATVSIAASSVTGTSAAPAWIEFIFDGTYTLTAGTPYVIGVGRSAGATDFSNYITIKHDSTSPTHAGNSCAFDSGSWSSDILSDRSFELYTSGPPTTAVPYASANLTDGATTTNRLGAGTGSFVAGKVSETGLVTDLGWSANNYTELLYSVTLKQADLTPTDTVRFRVLRLPLPVEALAASYSETNVDGTFALGQSGGSAGLVLAQANLGNGERLTRAGFWIAKAGAPTNMVFTARLYSHSGTFGTTATPGTLLATSTTSISTDSLTTTLSWQYFDFDGSVTLTNGTPYFIGIGIPTGLGTAVDGLRVGMDQSSPTHAGNGAWSEGGGSWNTTSNDYCFRLYTTPTSVMTYTQVPTITIAAGVTPTDVAVLGDAAMSLTDARLTEAGGMRGLEAASNRVTEDYSAGVVYSDDFNRADGVLGSPWAATGDMGGDLWIVTSNQASRNGFGDEYVVYGTAMGTPDHWIEADVTMNSEFMPINARGGATPGQNLYMGFVSPSGEATIGMLSGGGYGGVATGTTGLTVTGTHTARLEVEGTAIRFYWDDVLVASTTHSTHTTGQYVGFNAGSPNGRMDNFRAGPLPYVAP